MNASRQRGQSLIELLFAIAVFTIGILTSSYLIIETQTLQRQNIDFITARLLVREGHEAVRALRAEGFDNLALGEYGLQSVGGSWELGSSPDTQGKFDRTITISDAGENKREVTTSVVWTERASRVREISQTSVLTDWRQTSGDAKQLAVSIDAVALTSSSTVLTGISILNTGIPNVTITGMSVSWFGNGVVQRITIGGIDVFTATTSTGAASGEDIAIAHYLLEPSAGETTVDAIEFSEAVAGTDFLISFALEDGSNKHVYVEQ